MVPKKEGNGGRMLLSSRGSIVTIGWDETSGVASVSCVAVPHGPIQGRITVDPELERRTPW